ncbi:hypothetical protein D8674_035451 [Pyrus ussuriensis x Pyrus communis]|uniref:GDSL esterase/lipase 5-like n=1 Tax=Pyrus ussuriensis x Pyrus communis TaxID=2448454 RepID=A0A5N5GCF0_9ROSA|nr:hypothetical protein D8674_035451 [Pyrus ussuriensis x Pyrus communis]
MEKQRSVSVVLFLHAALLISTCFGSKSWPAKKQVALFIFGDSYLDSGNNNYINTTTLDQANFWPYGETYFKFPTGRFSDGRLMSDFIAEYAHLPFVPPFLQPGFRQYYGGANFASAGAGALVETFQGEEIYSGGGRKFGFINLLDSGCLPGVRIIKPENNGSCLKEVSSLAKLHNKALSKLLIQLGNQLEGFKYSLYDLNSNLRQRIRHPSKYGFKEGKTACCGTGQFRGVFSCGGKRTVKKFELCEDPNEYVFWDSLHLTEKVYKQFANEMWSGRPLNSKSTTSLYSLKDLFQDL